MPLTLSQGIVIGLDKESRTPTLPTIGGIINEVDYENSFVETENINDINFISEGFLSLYKYTLETKPSERWKKLGMLIGAIVVIAALVIASIFTCGTAAVAAGATIATVSLGAASGLGAMAAITAVVAGGLIVASTAAVLTEELVVREKRASQEVKQLKGRYAEIPEGLERKPTDESLQITNDFINRIIVKGPSKNI